ncbi:MBG domain-containing protein [Acinetobacter bereziniae]|uniref:MBG domain-containing protein n=1 Tax=Acinetobacter bereziniae TaxID=106648 RepID=UPI001250BC85|nr:MBG domain-containing protein [Acinetobacter bereziniae]
MNKIYKVIWNAQLGCWQAVSELAKNHRPSQSTVTDQNKTMGIVEKVSALILFGLALLPLSVQAAISNIELPTGAQINSGSATISQNGHTLNINQSSQTLSTNWNSFNIGQDATVNFNQNNASSVAINHVLDSNASQIMGRLNANGQVFLLNPNGVVFSKTAQVNVGGLVASTLALTDHDIQNGQFTLKGDANSHASIENYGTIQTLKGGTVALIAPNVKNTGSITTPNGTTHLTSASQVTLALQDGSLTQYQVEQGVLKGLVDNGGAILADNGAVYLTAKAKDSLSKAVVNHSGIIEANRLSQNAKGEIILLGDMQTGTTTLSGVLKAEGKNGQDGGFIETSAADVKIDQTTAVSTRSDSGKTGTWLIDPTDFSINSGNASASSSGIGATTLASSLATSNVILLTSTTGNQKGDINVNADVTWGSATSLTLNAQNNININANITATNNSGKLNLIYGQNTANTSANYYINNGAKINLKAGQNFSTQKGTAATINYQVITALGAQGSTTSQDLQGINGNLSGNYVLGADIDASSTELWNGYTGFDPIGFYNANLSPMDLSQQAFRGRFDGLGHAINGLSIESMYQGIGLFAITHQDALIQNVGLTNIGISGYGKTGGLVGLNLGTINNAYVNTGLVTGNTEQYGGLVGWNFNYGNILNSYANVTVKGKYSNNNYIGGLVGYSDGLISSSFATGPVTGNNYVGGLVGGTSGPVNNSYATGTVIGNQYVGGLVGFNGGNVDKTYSSGNVIGNQYVGGLVGGGNGITTNSFWNTSTSGRTSSAGGVGKTTTELQQISTFANWDVDDAGGTGKIWRIYEGRSAPLLRHFLKPLVTEVVANFANKTYDGVIASGTLASGLNYKTTGKNAGVYSLNDGSILISGVPTGANTTQFGNDVIYKDNGGSGTLTIATKSLNIGGLSAVNKVYNASKSASLTGNASIVGGISGDSISLSGTGIGLFSDKNVGNDKNVTVSGFTLSGTDALNYTLLQPTNLKANITPAVLTINGISIADKTYDGLSNATINGTASINPIAGDFVGLSGSGIGTFTDKNAGIRSVIVTGYNLTGLDAANYIFSQPIGLSATIHKAQAIVKANSLNTTYNGKNQTASGFSATGLVNGEDSSVLTGVTASVTAKDAGSYANKANGVDKNYDLTFVDGALDIVKAKATVTANSLNTTYNGQNQTAAGFSATGLVNGEDSSVLSGVTASITAKDAGSYTNKANGVDKNYDLTFVDGALDIAKAKATVTANSLNTTYNGKNQTASGFSVTGLVNGEDSSVLTGVTASVTAKDAGSYTNKANGVDKNYDLTFVDGALDIAKAKATVTANSVSTVYNGQNQTATGFSATGLVNGEDSSVLTGVTASVTAKDAGSYTNKASGVDKNYDLSFVDGALDIAKAKATVTANSLNTTYNGKDQTASGFSATGLVNSEDSSVLTGVTASVTAKDAGSYSNKVNGVDKNYDLTFVDGALNIAKAKATVTANSLNTTYNGKNQTASGFSATGLVNGEDSSVLTGVTASVTVKDAGSYTNKANGVDKNYDLTFVDGALNIAKAKATVTANSLNTTYNGKNQTASGFSATGLVNGETESVLSGVTASVTAKDAGSYTNKANGVDKNYDLTFVDGALDIAKAKATVTANSVSTVYNGQNQTASGFSATGLVNDETESVLSGVTASITAKDAGSYTNKANGVDKNYDLTFVDGALDIAKAKATVTANSVSTVYNGKNQTVSGFSATGLVNGETESVLSGVTASVTAKDAGSYANKANGVDKNYDLTFVDGALDIAKAKATVKANSLNTTYNGKNQTASGFSATGLVNGEDSSVLTGVTASITAKDAGSYTNKANGVDKNYDLTFVDGALDIAKAKATVTANSVSSVYNGQNQTATGFSATGLVNGEDSSVLTGVTASVTAKDAGSYSNKANGVDKNYDLTFVDGALNIAKAKATVTANSLNTTYNGKNQTASGFSVTGLVNGEDSSVLTGVTASITAKDAGSYTNKANGVDKNYDLTFVDGALDIAKAKATVMANSLNTTYNGKNQTTSGFSATGLVNGEDSSVLTGVTASVTAKDAGSYSNKANGVDKNYDLSFVDGALDIAKAEATVTANSVSTVYNGQNQTVSGFSATGLVNGEDSSVLTGVTASVTAKDAGSYANKANGVDKNYDLTFVDGALDIAKAKATVTANSVSTVYNGQNQTASGFSATGLVNGETESVLTGVTASVTAKDAGSYANKANGVDKNYDLTFVDGALDIAKAKATVTADSLNTTYNGKNQTASGFSATGLVNGEDSSVLTGVTASVTAKDAGRYTNKANGVDKNYDLSFVDGALDIAKAKINQVTGITANNHVYDASTQATLNTAAAQFTGQIAGDELKVLLATGQFSDKNVGNAKQVSIQGISLSGADAHNYELVNNTAQTTADISQAKIQYITGIRANNRTYNGLTIADLDLSHAEFSGIYAGDNLNVATATGQFDNATTGQSKNVLITGLSLGGLDAQNYTLLDTTAKTTADIYMLTPTAYLQAIQFKRPHYLPETQNALNTVNLDVRQGGVNTTGIQILAGEH